MRRKRRTQHVPGIVVFESEAVAPSEMVAAVRAAVAADPGHTVSLIGVDINSESLRRAHDWLVYESEAEVTEVMLAGAVNGWTTYWGRHGHDGNLKDALKRAVAEALMQMPHVPR